MNGTENTNEAISEKKQMDEIDRKWGSTLHCPLTIQSLH